MFVLESLQRATVNCYIVARITAGIYSPTETTAVCAAINVASDNFVAMENALRSLMMLVTAVNVAMSARREFGVSMGVVVMHN